MSELVHRGYLGGLIKQAHDTARSLLGEEEYKEFSQHFKEYLTKFLIDTKSLERYEKTERTKLLNLLREHGYRTHEKSIHKRVWDEFRKMIPDLKDEGSFQEIIRILAKGERVDPGFAVSLLNKAFDVKLRIYGSTLLGERHPRDLDVYMEKGEKGRRFLQHLLRKLTGTKVNIKEGPTSRVFSPSANKIYRVVNSFSRARVEDMERDLGHLSRYLETLRKAPEEIRNTLE